MRRFLFAAFTLALVFAGTVAGKAADVSVDFFYDNLSGGSWIEVGDYGYCWQPDVAVSDPAWRPYADGYWAYTDLGWTWVSYEDFGWATYHYGRWARLADYGWIWVPGRDEDLNWGPAWVSWRTGGRYIGWAPLPPETIGVVESGPVEGDIDVRFNIGPAYYNFVEARYIGEPVLRERIVDYRQNVTYVNETVNVTNITYKNKIVYNYGPDVNVVNSRASRPIQRLKIERQDNADLNAAVRSGALLKPQGDRLVVAAPMHISKAQGQAAPRAVKTKVATANFDRGWSEVGDQNAQNQFREKLKTQQAHKAEILAERQENTNAAIEGQKPSTAAPAGRKVPVTPQTVERGVGRAPKQGNERLQRNNPPTAAASSTPATGASPQVSATMPERGHHPGRNRPESPISSPTAGDSASRVSPRPSAVTAGEGAKPDRKGGKPERPQDGRFPKGTPEAGEAGAAISPNPETEAERQGGRHNRKELERPPQASEPPQTNAGAVQPNDRTEALGGRGKRQGEQEEQGQKRLRNLNIPPRAETAGEGADLRERERNRRGRPAEAQGAGAESPHPSPPIGAPRAGQPIEEKPAGERPGPKVPEQKPKDELASPAPTP